MKLRHQAIQLAALVCMLPSLANGECKGRSYKISGTAIDKAGRPLSAPISFSWIEEYNGRSQTIQTQAKAGRYSVDIPFYPQAKQRPVTAVLDGDLYYRCDARLKSVSYTFPSARGSQSTGVIQILGPETSANLSIQSAASPPNR